MSAAIPFPAKLAVYTTVLFSAALVSALTLAMAQGAPPPLALVVFGGLAVFGAQRRVRFPSGVHLSPAFLLVITSTAVFVDVHAIAGGMVTAMLSAVWFPGLRRGAWGWVPFNAGVSGIAVLAGSGVYSALPQEFHARVPLIIVAVVPTALAVTLVSGILLALSFVVELGEIPKDVLSDMRLSFAQVLVFALLGFLLGHLYLSLGPAVMLLIVVPILIAREMFASYLKVKESHDETVQMLIHALEQKDRYTSGHSERVAKYAQYMGEQFNFGPARMERLRFAALMHDIGKLVVPNHLLNKPGKLTEDEFARIRLHE
jgi:hypothetical protein